jgi:hypothetical protein
VAQGESYTGLALTTVMMKSAANDNSAKETPFHIIWNKKTDSVLIVGEGEVSDNLLMAYQNANTTYINKLDPDAEKRIRSNLFSLMGADAEKNVSLLKNAFLMRNMLDSMQAEESATLESLLASKDVQTYLPLYLTKGAATPKPNAA